MFAGRLIRGVKNGPSPAWLQARLRAIGLRPISALVDVTNLLSYDRARPLHVYDAAKLIGGVSRRAWAATGEQPRGAGRQDLRGDARDVRDRRRAPAPIGLGGVMGGESTGCSEATTDVFVESAWFDPIRTAQTGRDTGITSDAQYRFARGVDPGFVVPGLELATRLILELCGGEPSEVVVAGSIPAPPAAFDFDPGYVHRLSGLAIGRERIVEILTHLGFESTPHGATCACSPRPGGATWRARPTWSRRWRASSASPPCRPRPCPSCRAPSAAC